MPALATLIDLARLKLATGIAADVMIVLGVVWMMRRK